MGIHLHVLALIACIPMLAFYLFYHSSSYSIIGRESLDKKIGVFGWFLVYLCSLAFTYTNMTLVVHQVGFYELFFTDIMQGSDTSQKIVDDFMAVYGRKHRHFGHGIFHGAINATLFCIPVFLLFSYIYGMTKAQLFRHIAIWLVVSMIIGGLLAVWV